MEAALLEKGAPVYGVESIFKIYLEEDFVVGRRVAVKPISCCMGSHFSSHGLCYAYL